MNKKNKIESRLFSYKMTDDSGFAPNPFHGFLTLACCKPFIRKSKKLSDWIAGFTSKELNGDEVGKEKLIFLMKITDIKSFKEYWEENKFKVKKYYPKSKQRKFRRGDNIYKPNSLYEFGFEQIPNKCHNEKNIKDDLSGENVLISEHFYYFGRNALLLDKEIRPKVPKGSAKEGVRTYDDKKIEKFLNYIKINFTLGRNKNNPHEWGKKVKNKC